MKTCIIIYKNKPQYKGCDEYIGDVTASTTKREDAMLFSLGLARKIIKLNPILDNAHEAAEIIQLKP